MCHAVGANPSLATTRLRQPLTAGSNRAAGRLTNKQLNDNGLAESLRDAPANAIVLLEDVDAVFADRKLQSESRNSGVTFSGLLNALDGVASQEGRLFFMTTK